jgi:glycosyltransferase involved in cell wall biosynthesis
MISKAMTTAAYHGKARELARLGVKLTVVVPHRWGKQALEEVRPDGYELVVMDCNFSGAHHFHYYPSIHSLVASQPWDLVHIDEDPFNFVTYHIMRACDKNRRSAVFFSWQNCYKSYPPPFGFFEKFSYRTAKAAIAGNTEVAEVLRKRSFRGPISVIPQFGVDPELFTRRDSASLRRQLHLEGIFVIGFVGRMVPGKGIDDLLAAIKHLPADCALLMVGDGPLQRGAQRQAESLGFANRVRWVPRVSSHDVPRYMSLMQALVLPSTTVPFGRLIPTGGVKEQFGRVLVESMACGTVVVGSNSGEIPNVIGDAGLVFPEADVAALAASLRRLYDDPALISDLSAKGRARVLNNFAHRRIAERTVELYVRALGRAPSGASVLDTEPGQGGAMSISSPG